MATLELPVRPEEYSYLFTLDLDGTTYTMRFKYNERMGRWMMEIGDVSNVDAINGIPMQINANLLRQIVVADKPQGTFFLLDESGQELETTLENFGISHKLTYDEV
jgi:hypothetical protein